MLVLVIDDARALRLKEKERQRIAYHRQQEQERQAALDRLAEIRAEREALEELKRLEGRCCMPFHSFSCKVPFSTNVFYVFPV